MRVAKIHQYQYYFVIFSILLSLVGFSYNVWRLESTENNNTIRTASFEILLELSALEQLVYYAHYDKNIVEGSPRKGWVKVGLINDLSPLAGEEVMVKSKKLMQIWSSNWSSIEESQLATEQVVSAIEATRDEINIRLTTLE
ncbi:hypothetical protein D5R81_07175 [Parashewanella spongiae]|uniref:Uncharacterized protein n=1 Tax=Parashewanella spongiae TaxID=342950 RepID=A0A3A6U933_9GAMM|nr:hypothetical protein [Parashewanella spongiae]RJY18015.1 hypothetical protein D5R81_07175 [Parashewanella spongiae]